MLWFITLLVLALAAFLIIKAIKAKSARQSAEDQRLREGSGLAGSLNHEAQSSSAAAPENLTDVSESGEAGQSKPASAGVAAASAGVAAVAGASAAAVAGAGTGTNQPSSMQSAELNTGDTFKDVQEMIKVLNLAEPDAGRLNISRDQFTALRSGNSSAAPASDQLTEVAAKLRSMLA